jgi:hypothetical protein
MRSLHSAGENPFDSYGNHDFKEQWVFPYLYTTEVPDKGMVTVGKVAILDVTQSELNALTSLQLEVDLLKMAAVDSFWRGEMIQHRIIIITSKTRPPGVSVDEHETWRQKRKNELQSK